MPRSASVPAFVGREAELEVLCDALVSLEETGARTLLIGGEAGIGKTRLVDEFAARAGAAGALVVTGVCTPAEGSGLPYGPVVGILRELARRLDGSDAEPLRRARAGLGLDGDQVATERSAGEMKNEMGKTRLFEALLACFTALAERSRLVLVFEDLHWADSSSMEVIDFLTRNMRDSPALMIGTYRSEELDEDRPAYQVLAELGRLSSVSPLDLSGIDRDATAALMAVILGHQPEWSLIDAVYGRSGGNPFFAEELTAARDTATIPSALRNVIMLRVGRLSPEARRVVDLTAVAGASIDHRLLAATSDLAEPQLRAALAEAVELHVLMVADGSRFRFRHALQRDAVYGALLPTDRALLHRVLAVALTTRPELGATGPGHAAVELAGHWWDADEMAEALHASIAAADRLAEMLAMPEAAAHYERALAACDRLPDGTGRDTIDHTELLLKAAAAAFVTSSSQRSVELASAALERIDPASDPRRAAVAYTVLGRNGWAIGDAEGSFAAFSHASALLPADPPSVELADVIAEEARALLLVARYAESEARAHDAIEIARTVGSRAAEGHALTTLGACLAERGEIDEGIVLVRDALEIAEDLGRPDLLDLVYKILSHVLMNSNRLAEAADVVFQGIARDDRSVGVRLNGAGHNSAEALIRLGRYDEAADLLARMDERGAGSCVFGPQAVRALLDIRRGRYEEATTRLASAEAFSSGLNTVQVRGWFHILRAEVALEQGRPEEAYDEAERGLTLAAGTDDQSYRPEMCAFAVRALADEYEGARARNRRIDADKFHRLASALVEHAELCVLGNGGGSDHPLERGRAHLAWCVAEESRLDGSDPDAWDRAAQAWADVSEPHREAYCRLRQAEAILGGGGSRVDAAAAAQSAWLLARRMGAPTLQAAVERLAQRARLALVAEEPAEALAPHLAVAEDLGLTAREVEVLAQLARGRTDKQIADELFISRKTASVHVSNILRKLDAANRLEAAEIGQRAGLE